MSPIVASAVSCGRRLIERWQWQVKASFPMQGQHINALELQVILSALRWRTAKPEGIRRRICQLADSQVCLACLAKGRSSSFVLNHILAKVNAVVLSANLLPLWGFISSGRNPADRPSRWW